MISYSTSISLKWEVFIPIGIALFGFFPLIYLNSSASLAIRLTLVSLIGYYFFVIQTFAKKISLTENQIVISYPLSFYLKDVMFVYSHIDAIEFIPSTTPRSHDRIKIRLKDKNRSKTYSFDISAYQIKKVIELLRAKGIHVSADGDKWK